MLLTSLSPSEIKRVKISALLKAGKGIKEVATECQVSRRTVFYCKNRSEIKDKKRSGRSTKLSPKTKLKVRDQMKDVPGSSTRKCPLSLNNSFDCFKGKNNIKKNSSKVCFEYSLGKNSL